MYKAYQLLENSNHHQKSKIHGKLRRISLVDYTTNHTSDYNRKQKNACQNSAALTCSLVF